MEKILVMPEKVNKLLCTRKVLKKIYFQQESTKTAILMTNQLF
jgi:hypothetical protein